MSVTMVEPETKRLAREHGCNVEQRIFTAHLDPNDIPISEGDDYGLTQSYLRDWLREIYGYNIEVPLYSDTYRWRIRFKFVHPKGFTGYSSSKSFDEYEDALEEALLYTLKLIEL